MKRGIPDGHGKKFGGAKKIPPSNFFQRGRQETIAYRFCRKRMNDFLRNPSKKSWGSFNEAHKKLFTINPSQANAIMVVLEKEVFNKAIKIESLQ